MDRSRPSKAFYLALPLLLVLFFLESRLSLSGAARQLAQLAIVLVVIGFVHWVISRERLRCCENQ